MFGESCQTEHLVPVESPHALELIQAMITYTTINREIGAWIREFREQWMVRTNPGWSFPQRFLCAFVGACISVLAVILSLIPDVNISFLEIALGNLAPVFLVLFILAIPFIFWFAWLVSWKDFHHGPIRLFLSSIFLVIVTFSLTRWIVILSFSTLTASK